MSGTAEDRKMMEDVKTVLSGFGRVLVEHKIGVVVTIVAFTTGLKETAYLVRKQGAPPHYLQAVAATLRATADLFEHGTEPHYDLDLKDLEN